MRPDTKIPRPDILSEIRSCIEAEFNALADRVDGLRRQLDRYLASYERSVVAVAAEELGVPPQDGRQSGQFARDVREEVSRLVREARSASVADTTEAELLLRELDTLGLDAMDDDLFCTYAEEYAARARLIQQRVGDRGPRAPETRLIRALTRRACVRGISDVFGLARHHHDDWDGRIEKARRHRAALEEARATGDVVPTFTPPLERLARVTDGRPIVLFGGEPQPEKLARIRKLPALTLEWVDGRDAGVLAARVRSKAVAGVVILDGFLAHKDSDVVLAALRNHHVPFAFAGRGGLASIERALEALENAVGHGR